MRAVVAVAAAPAGAMHRIAATVVAIAIAVVLVGQPVVVLAASGWKQDRTCCCPDQRDCKCPHGNNGNSAPVARKCGDAGSVIVPAEMLVTMPATAPVLVAPAPIAMPAIELPAPKLAPPIEIETPPF